MRMIGHLGSEAVARTFSDYLYVKGIKNQIEAESDGRWALWIHAEDELDHARRLLQAFLANPHDPVVKRAAAKASDLIAREKEQESTTKERHFDRDRLFSRGLFFGMGPMTLSLIVISVLVYVLRNYTSLRWVTDYLFIGDPGLVRDLPEVRQGQVWRVLTPIFLHFGVLHIVFNMLWMGDLGSLLEDRLGTLQFALLVVVIGVASNLGQYFINGPDFGGMSGVVYGLLGYTWLRGKFDPSSGLFLHPTTVAMMLIWLVLGYTSYSPVAMANTVHTIGLAIGAMWGFLAAQVQTR